MTIKHTFLTAAAALVFSGSLLAESFQSYSLDQTSVGMKSARGAKSSEMTLVLDHEAEVSAFQFAIDLTGTGLRFTQAKGCLSGLPASHKGENAMVSCRVLNKGRQLMVVALDLQGMAAIPNGIIGTVRVASDGMAKAGGKGGQIKDLGLWDTERNEVSLNPNQSPILVSFE